MGGKLVRRKVNRKSLTSRPKGVSTRILVFSYDDIWELDRDVLDDVSYTLDLDPVSLWQMASRSGRSAISLARK
jgi:hypothetical protein